MASARLKKQMSTRKMTLDKQTGDFHSSEEQLELIFETLDSENKGKISTVTFRDALEVIGLHSSIIKSAVTFLDPHNEKVIPLADFLRLRTLENNVVERGLKACVAVPDFQAFCNDLKSIFDETQENRTGHNATYIPQLARVDPEQFGLSVCTIDGQVFSHGDSEVGFTAQSCSKPLTFCMATEDRGEDLLMKHVGHEPSGKKFNAFVLNDDKLPHNPMINSGAIMTASLFKPELEPSDRFDTVLQTWSDLAGGARVGFDNATYLSELRHADRNFSLAYFMKDAGSFDSNVRTSEDVRTSLEFYFQLCSILITCENAAVIAATLANGGVNPISGKRIFKPCTVRNCLSLMFSCGMYDYSGEFAYTVGLPAKSGVAGCVMVVVPNVMGIATWSPRLDRQGNSVRGVDFFSKLTQRFSFHVFDDIVSGVSKKTNARLRRPVNAEVNTTSELCFAAAYGDLTHLRALVANGANPSVSDYDGRTPLHLAAAERRELIVSFLLEHHAEVNGEDRLGQTPLDEAKDEKIMAMLKAAGARHGNSKLKQ